MSWFNTTPKKPYNAREAMYKEIDAKNIKWLRQDCSAVLLDSVTYYDTSCCNEGVLLYLRSRGLIKQHPVVAYLYRLT